MFINNNIETGGSASTSGLDRTFVRPAHQMALKMIKHIIKHIRRSSTLKSITPKLLEMFKFHNKIKT